MMLFAYLFSKFLIIIFGILYPAFCSFKAIRDKDVRAYVNLMMYWIVFALFSVMEIFTDLLLAFWFPFYYELKMVFFLWLILPITRGATYLYRRYIHPTLLQHEYEIDCLVADIQKRTVDYVCQTSYHLITSVVENLWKASTPTDA